MSGAEFWYLAAGALALAGCAAGLFSLLHYRRLIGRMSDILQRCRQGTQAQEILADTRESKLEGQLRRLLRQSSSLREQAQKEHESLAALLSDLSHQLKTPLANVVMDAELLKESNLSPAEQKQFTAHIGEQAQKMQWLLSALVKASRLEHGILQYRASMQDIRPTLTESVSAVYGQALKKEISIVTAESANLLLYHNRKWTAEAIANILENAVKYSPCGSQIRIETEPLAIYTKINILDQGQGVPKEEYNQIFRRFYRGAQAQETEGTGLGLYLAQVILAQEKGYVTVSENPQGGSCFSVFLLNKEESAAADEEY